MISKNDLLLLLTELQEQGNDVQKQIKELMYNDNISLDVLKFINDRRPLDVVAFYNNIRVNYNKKKSNLYINIVKEIEDPEEVLTTLSAMLTQILLYSKKLVEKQKFLKQARAQEITLVLDNYFKTYNITNALKLLRLIKADIKALESIK